MPRFIKLTGHKQNDVFLNPDKIVYVEDCSQGGKFPEFDYRRIALDPGIVEVKNSIDEILMLCQGPTRRFQ